MLYLNKLFKINKKNIIKVYFINKWDSKGKKRIINIIK